MLEDKERPPSQHQEGDDMTYSEKEELKKLPEASSCPTCSGLGRYDHIDRLFIDTPSITDYWITARLNTEFKGNACIWYTETKETHGGRVK
ncbi:hypothetical protein O181_123480 [Austropuccinia psidii MF-1]|uniref:Uncharacterized protein n=1 Tax=Austropuccinia psidii MF-1 TaxID=1389203 RepID=A0A9Q3KR85_9BASI|nr:hypothetical protein [Austropuccinia psidii MF-1]